MKEALRRAVAAQSDAARDLDHDTAAPKLIARTMRRQRDALLVLREAVRRSGAATDGATTPADFEVSVAATLDNDWREPPVAREVGGNVPNGAIGERASFPILPGIRQCCPTSGSLWAVTARLAHVPRRWPRGSTPPDGCLTGLPLPIVS